MIFRHTGNQPDALPVPQLKLGSNCNPEGSAGSDYLQSQAPWSCSFARFARVACDDLDPLVLAHEATLIGKAKTLVTVAPHREAPSLQNPRDDWIY